MKTPLRALHVLILVVALFVGLSTPFDARADGLVILVDNLQPSWAAPGGGGVFAAYIGPPDYGYISPGGPALYLGREAGIIKAGLEMDPTSGNYEDEGLFGFKPAVTIEAFAAGEVSYDVANQEGTNPVWMTIEIDTFVAGDRADNTTYQHVPASNPAGWHTVNAAAGQWQKWNNNNGDVSGNPLISLGDVATAHPDCGVVRAYLRLGMGNSYHGSGAGTLAWVDKVVLGDVTYDFVLPTYWYVDPTGADTNEGTLASPFLTIQHAIDMAADGDTVHVAAGTYEEQLIINKSVLLAGAGASATHIVAPPPASRQTFTIPESSATFDPVVIAFGGTRSGGAISGAETIDFAMSGFHVNGNNDAQASPRYAGILLRNASPGAISNNLVDGLAPAAGNPETGGIFVYGDSNAAISGNTISSHTRIGIVARGDGDALADPTAVIQYNTVTGLGPTGVGSWAQNGIQLSDGAAGSIEGNIVTGHSFAGSSYYAASSIMVVSTSGTVNVSGNTVTNGQAGIYWIDASGSIADNDISVTAPFAVCAPCNGEIDGIIVDPGPSDRLVPPWPVDAAGDAPGGEQASTLAGAVYTVVASDNRITGEPSAGSYDTVGLWVVSDGTDTLDFSAQRNTITGWDDGVIYYADSGATLNVHDLADNCILGNTYYGAYNYTTTPIDMTGTWWGDGSGPYHATVNPGGLGNGVSDNVAFVPWADSCGGDPIANFQNARTGAYYAVLQNAINDALPRDTILAIGPGPFGAEGHATVPASKNGITIKLNGRTFGPGSPWLVVEADDTTIRGPGIIDGWTGSAPSADPAIRVMAGADNLILQGAEIKRWASGVSLEGSVVSFKVGESFIHDNTGAGLVVASGAKLTGVVTIEGNLFKDNGGPGVQHDGIGTLPVQYNAWGDLAGTTGPLGDGVAGAVDASNHTFAEVSLDVEPETEATVRHIIESTSVDVKLKADAAKLYGLTFKFTYDTEKLTLTGTTFAAPWAGRCTEIPLLPAGTVGYFCNLLNEQPTADPEWNADGGTIATFHLDAWTGPLPPDNGPWVALFDISHLETDTGASAIGGQKVFLNNAGYNAPSVAARDITDDDDGRIVIERLANYTGFVDLQGRYSDDLAMCRVYDQADKAGAIELANGESASNGAYTTAHLPSKQLLFGNSYYVTIDRWLFLSTTPTSATTFAHSKLLDTCPTTTLPTVFLLGGDATNDEIILVNDLSCIGGDYGKTTGFTLCGGTPGTGLSDVNEDGRVNVQDLSLAGGNLYKTSSPWTVPSP